MAGDGLIRNTCGISFTVAHVRDSCAMNVCAAHDAYDRHAADSPACVIEAMPVQHYHNLVALNSDLNRSVSAADDLNEHDHDDVHGYKLIVLLLSPRHQYYS